MQKNASRFTPWGFFLSAHLGTFPAASNAAQHSLSRHFCVTPVVGYDSFSLRAGEGGSIAAIGCGASFANISGNTIKLKELVVTGYNKDDGYSDFKIYARKLDGAGIGGTKYYWCDFEDLDPAYPEEEEVYKKFYGWYSDDLLTEYNDSVTLEPCEGLWIYSPSSSYKIQDSGVVPEESLAINLRGDTTLGTQAILVANPMPYVMNLGRIDVKGYTKDDGYSDFKIYGRKLDGAGIGGTKYYWCDFEDLDPAYPEEQEVYKTFYGWYSDDLLTEYNDTVSLDPGETLWIYSPDSKYSVEFPPYNVD